MDRCFSGAGLGVRDTGRRLCPGLGLSRCHLHLFRVQRAGKAALLSFMFRGAPTGNCSMFLTMPGVLLWVASATAVATAADCVGVPLGHLLLQVEPNTTALDRRRLCVGADSFV